MKLNIINTRNSDKAQQTVNSFDRTQRKKLQDTVISEKEYESLTNIFKKCTSENREDSFF